MCNLSFDNKHAIVLCVSKPQKKRAKKNVFLAPEQTLNTPSALRRHSLTQKVFYEAGLTINKRSILY